MTTNGHGHATLFRELESVRRARDWTYLQLAGEIQAVTNRHRDQDCLRRICQGQVAKPHARTVDILQAFLHAVHTPSRRRPRTGRRPATSRKAS